jgi:hypothetical protein
MRDLTSLNSLYEEYQQGNLTKRDLEGKMFTIILENIQDFRLFNGDEEESTDYLCWLYPRLSRAVKNYQANGAVFSTYIGALIRYSLREYRSRRLDHCITEYAAWTAQAAEMEVRSLEAGYPEIDGEETGGPARTIPLSLLKSRQVLLLILKSYYFLSEDFIDRIAPYTGLGTEKLRELIEKLRIRRSRREEAFLLARERIATQFYRCITWEKRLKAVMPGSVYYETIQNKLERARNRLARMRKRFASFKIDATHQQIAELLGISPGTVSSSLYMLRSHWGMDKTGRPVKKGRKKKGPAPFPLPGGEDAPAAGGDKAAPPGLSCGEPCSVTATGFTRETRPMS